MNYKAALAIIGVFIGCCFDALFLEYAARIDPGCGNLITFLQFLTISLYGLFFTAKFFTVKPNIPINDYFTLVVMFFVSTWLNNYALNFNVSVPLIMIFRSGSLMANMVLGILILNKSYDLWKYISVIMITIGIFMCTIATGSNVKSHSDKDSFFYWMIGIGMLSLALFIGARMGLYQEVLYKKRGKHASEALFYTHFLPLPAFLFMASNIYNHTVIASQSELVTLPILNITSPVQFIYLTINFLSHYLCISSVYVLTTECTSLTVTLVITLRKFASIIYSIFYFKHPFTFYHWSGTIFIIIGTIIFTEIHTKIRELGKASDKSIEEAPLINNNSENKNGEKLSFYRKLFTKSRRKLNFIPKPHGGAGKLLI